MARLASKSTRKQRGPWTGVLGKQRQQRHSKSWTRTEMGSLTSLSSWKCSMEIREVGSKKRRLRVLFKCLISTVMAKSVLRNY
uniref:Uncharacterized protein n=1 Tax=Lotus japonicus TaxID=34305 RepID=I3T9E7_LOTJA|nr:unknown [Lotus japonicus]